jgi:hypothetical protein
MDRKSQVEKLPPPGTLLNLERVVLRESNPALESDEPSKVDDGQLPGKAVELPALSNIGFPVRECIRQTVRFFDSNGRFLPVWPARLQLAQCMRGHVLKLLRSEQTSIDRIIQTPRRQFPDFKML